MSHSWPREVSTKFQDPEVRARVLALHGQGHGPCRIARATRISRKQVARLLESEGITREPSRPASARLPEILELRRQELSGGPGAGEDVLFLYLDAQPL
jgi:hypothetical protein